MSVLAGTVPRSTRPPRFAALAMVAAFGCAGSVRLGSADRDRLRGGPDIAVAYEKSPHPWVDCRGDEGKEVWTFGGAAMAWPPPARRGPVVELVSAPQRPLLAGDTWTDIEEEWTKTLRESPPEDPARATAGALLALATRAPGSMPLGQSVEEAPAAGPRSLAARPGAGPILSVKATRWVLSGCFFKYTPWFTAEATLLEAGTGRVLWRHSCGGMYPSPGYREAEAAELEADGQSLYRSLIEQRAAQCARAFLRSLEGGVVSGPGGTGELANPGG